MQVRMKGGSMQVRSVRQRVRVCACGACVVCVHPCEDGVRRREAEQDRVKVQVLDISMVLSGDTCETVAERQHRSGGEGVAGAARALVARRVLLETFGTGKRVVVVWHDDLRLRVILEPHLVALDVR